MYYGREIILVTYANDTLFFRPDLKAIKGFSTELEGLGCELTHKKGDRATAFAFLGVSILSNSVTKQLKLGPKPKRDSSSNF
jgi:hypothetical protein